MDVSLVLTHDCNLGCSYCFAGAKTRRRMSDAVLSRALELAFSDELNEVRIALFGGEPTLEWDRVQQVAYEAHALAARHGRTLRLTMTTNATRIDRARAAFLREAGFYLAVSVDGTEAAHDATRRRRGGGSSYAQVMRGLMACLYAGVELETISVVDPRNVVYLGESIRHLAGLGIDRLALNPSWSADWSAPTLASWERGYEVAGALLVEEMQRGRALHVSAISDKMLAHAKGGLDEGDRCAAGRGSIAVAPSGNLYPCSRMVGEDGPAQRDLILGHTERGIDRGRLAVFRALHEPAAEPGIVHEACGGCAVRSRCMSSCACANREETGEVGVAGGLLCWHEQLAARVADRVAERLYRHRDRTFLRVLYALPTDGVRP